MILKNRNEEDMNKRKIVFRLGCILLVFLFSSCREELPIVYFDFKNNSSKTLHVDFGGKRKMKAKPGKVILITNFHAKHITMKDCFAEYEYCEVRENDADGRVLRLWTKDFEPTSQRKEFFRESDWRKFRDEYYDEIRDYLFTITDADLETEE